jgi:hypothetical protein
MAFRVGELRDLEPARNLVRTQHSNSAKVLRLDQRNLDVWNLHIDRNVPLIAFGPRRPPPS